MKKQLALSAVMLALAGASHAQSSVTLFGLIDLNLNNAKAGTAAGGAGVSTMNDGTVNGLNGTRWGMRTSEDLGGGLKAGATLESGFGADTGNSFQGGRAFGRQVFLSLGTAAAGEVRLGRQYILSDSVVGQSNPFGNALTLNPGTGVTNMGKALPMFLNAPRADNTVQYQSPNFGGVTGAVQWAPGEGTADRFYGTRLTYGAGPLFVGMAYEWNKSRTTGASTNKSMSLSANYNFGAFKVLGGIQRNRDLTTTSVNGAASGVSNLIVTGPTAATTFTMDRNDGVTFGVEAPVGATTLGVNYSRVTYKAATGADADLGKLAFGARYSLSKNTFLYSSLSLATGDLKEHISQKRVVQVGLRTAF